MDIRLDVPYFSQIDNSQQFHGSGFRQCNLSTHAMAVDFLTKGDLSRRSKLNGFNEPESFYGAKLIKYGDTTNHDAHTACLKNEFGIDSEWRTNLSTKDLERQLQKGYVIPIGTHYRSSGHIILVVGINSRGFLVHDSFGIRNGNTDSYQIGADGSYDFYSFNLMAELWLDPGLPSSGWGRIFKS